MTNDRNEPGIDTTAGKREWVAPEISTFEAVSVTKGVSFKIGDGISNLS